MHTNRGLCKQKSNGKGMWPRLTRNPIQFYYNIFKFVNCNSDVNLHSIKSCDIALGEMSGKHLSQPQYQQTFKWKKHRSAIFLLVSSL